MTAAARTITNAAGVRRTASNTAAAATSMPVTARPTAGPRSAKRRWKARSSDGVVRRRVSSTASPRTRPNPVATDRATRARPVRTARTIIR